MPVYNGGKFLREAIDSILGQTFTDFEFLIINDGSDDDSVEIVESYHDERIRLYHNKKNMKIVATLNRGLNLAQGDYIARLDCDDISMATRLEKQVYFLDNNPQVALVGSWVEEINAQGDVISFISFLTDPAVLRWRLFLCNSFVHSSVTFRKAPVMEFGGYSDEFPYAEDYDLWSKLSFEWGVANLPEILVRWRNWDENCSAVQATNQFDQATLISIRNVKQIWPNAFSEQIVLLRKLYQRDKGITRKSIDDLRINLSILVRKFSQRFSVNGNIKVEIETHFFSVIQHSDEKIFAKVGLICGFLCTMKPNFLRILMIFFFKRTLVGVKLKRLFSLKCTPCNES